MHRGYRRPVRRVPCTEGSQWSRSGRRSRGRLRWFRKLKQLTSAGAILSEVAEVRAVVGLKGQALDLGVEGGAHHHGGHAWDLEKWHVL